MKNHFVKPGSEVGKANGLTVLLDAETFDYTYHLRAGEGKHLFIYLVCSMGELYIHSIDFYLHFFLL